MRRGVPFLFVFVTAGFLMALAGCSGDDTPLVTDFFPYEYQLTGYISNEPFQIFDLVMPDGGFVFAVNRMKEDSLPSNLAQVQLNGVTVPISSFPLNTPEQAVFTLDDIAFAAGKNYELLVTIGSGFATTSFQVPSTLYDVEITYPQTVAEKIYVPTLPIELRWHYSGGAIPYLVDVKAVDNFTGGIPALESPLDYLVTLDGANTQHTLSASVTRYFSNDLRIWVAIQGDVSWAVGGTFSLFPGSSIHFVNPADSVILEEICLDNDGDGFGNPATGICTYALLDCDDNNPAVNPGRTEGPIGTATCSDGLDNNCNGLIDPADEGCQAVVPGGD